MSAPVLSVVLPMYNEEAALEHSLRVVKAELEKVALPFELVCVDDGSRDRTLSLLQAAARADSRVRAVALSRNFGKEAAMAAGLEEARGRAVLFMDADLQHPPELVPKMVSLWQEGHDVVSAVKEERARESLVYRAFAGIFNRLMGGASGASFRGASDFKLLDRQVVNALLGCPERGRFFRGLVAWVGFRTALVPFTVADRVAGETKWSTVSLLRYSIKNLISFTALPLRMVAVLGFVTLALGALLGVQTLVRYFLGEALTGFTTVILLQLVLGGLLLSSIGVIALYLSEIYEEVKRRPVFLVRREHPSAASAEDSEAPSADEPAADEPSGAAARRGTRSAL